ncbi:unnamed protein product, partial [Sphacelaria rigidula]
EEASESGEESEEEVSGSDSDEDDSREEESGEESDEFEDQGSDSDDSEEMERQQAAAEVYDDSDRDGVSGGRKKKDKGRVDESVRKTWSLAARSKEIEAARGDGALSVSMAMHTDDLSSDDDDENRNTVGRGEG